MDESGKPKFSSVTNLSVSPEVSHKIKQARSLFGGSAFSLNKVPDQPLTPYRNASSTTDLTNDGDAERAMKQTSAKSNADASTKKTAKPAVKTPIKFADELKVITQNNEPPKKSTFGYIFKNFFK